MNPLNILQLAIKYGPLVKEAIDLASSNLDLAGKIKLISGSLAALLEEIGGALFPNAKPELHLVGGAIAAFDPNVTKWLQGALNALVTPKLNPQLVVDGIYGPHTRDAVSAFQKQMGLVVDGLAGQITQAAISIALTKLSGVVL